MLFYTNRDEGEANPDWSLELTRRSISREQMQRFERYVGEIFGAFGLDKHHGPK